MTKQVETLLTQLFTGDKAAAAETFNHIMAEKAGVAIDVMKQVAMDRQFNTESKE